MKDAIIAESKKVFDDICNKWPDQFWVFPTIEFIRNSRTSGQINYRTNTIRFNLDCAEENFDNFIDTIIHEFAHLVVHMKFSFAKQSHGPEFRGICQVLGGTGKTYHNFSSTPSKRVYRKTYYMVKCDCQSHWIKTRLWNKIVAGGRVYCRKCMTDIPPIHYGVKSA